MSFPTSKGRFKVIDTVLLGLIRLIIKRSNTLPLGQIFSSKFSNAVISEISTQTLTNLNFKHFDKKSILLPLQKHKFLRHEEGFIGSTYRLPN